jgi:hypothetical protein
MNKWAGGVIQASVLPKKTTNKNNPPPEPKTPKLKQTKTNSQGWWLTLIILATPEAYVEGSTI